MKNWLDLSYNKAGLWSTNEHFVLLFENEADRALAVQKFKDQTAGFDGYPRQIEMKSHGRFPAIFLPRELAHTPKAITAAFDRAGKTQVEDIENAIVLPPVAACISYNPFAWVSPVEVPWSMIDLDGKAFAPAPEDDLYTLFRTPEEQSSDEPDLPRRVFTNDLELAGTIDFDGHHPLFRISPQNVLRRPASAAHWLAASEHLKDLHRQAEAFKQDFDLSGWRVAVSVFISTATLLRRSEQHLHDPEGSMKQSARGALSRCLTEAVGAFIRLSDGNQPTQIETIRDAANAIRAEATGQGELEQNPQLAVIINDLSLDIEKVAQGENLGVLAHAVFQLHNVTATPAEATEEIASDKSEQLNADMEPVETNHETVYSKGSSGDKIDDFGVEIRGARKHFYASASASVIAAMTNDELSALKSTSTGGAIRRDSLWATINVRDEVDDKGRDPRMTLLRKAVQQEFASSYESVAYRRGRFHRIPSGYASEYGVRFYMTAIAIARDALSVSDEDLAYRWNETVEKAKGSPHHVGQIFIEDWITQPAKDAMSERFGNEFDFVTNRSLTSLLAKRDEFDWRLGLALSSIEITPDSSLLAKVQDHPPTRKKPPAVKKVKPTQDASVEVNVETETPTVADHLTHVERLNMPDWRKGQSISAQAFLDTFGFRGGQFGNWVPNKERQTWLDMSADAMHDLANYMGIAPKHIGFDGRLGMAWGARGKGRAAAHFEPGLNVINFTRKAGAGAMSHEWAHAFDHWLYRSEERRVGKEC